MGLFDTLKIKLLLKKVNTTPTKRDIYIPSIDKFHSALIILDKKDMTLKSKLELVFKNSKISMLYKRTKEELPSEENKYLYSYHVADLGFGKIKNERLIGLLNSNFDISIDFVTKNNDLNYWCGKTDCEITCHCACQSCIGLRLNSLRTN